MYCIKEDYNHRSRYSHFDDMINTDGWQKEVYLEAVKLLGEYETVADIGCGSGYKLVKFFGDIEAFTGYEIQPTLNKLRDKYPNHSWEESNFDVPLYRYDMVICADVIEHVLDPDMLINYLKTSGARTYVLSTPDRTLVYGGQHDGPPRNSTHIREWTYDEFGQYLRQHFSNVQQSITNTAQATQMAVCRT